MTDQAPRAHSQYDGQRWHVEFRIHVDLDTPNQTYVTAEISKKVGADDGYKWVSQEIYNWLGGPLSFPEPGACFHNYLLARLDVIRGWIMADHLAKAREHKDIAIRPEIGVSFPNW